MDCATSAVPVFYEGIGVPRPGVTTCVGTAEDCGRVLVVIDGPYQPVNQQTNPPHRQIRGYESDGWFFHSVTNADRRTNESMQILFRVKGLKPDPSNPTSRGRDGLSVSLASSVLALFDSALLNEALNHLPNLRGHALDIDVTVWPSADPLTGLSTAQSLQRSECLLISTISCALAKAGLLSPDRMLCGVRLDFLNSSLKSSLEGDVKFDEGNLNKRVERSDQPNDLPAEDGPNTLMVVTPSGTLVSMQYRGDDFGVDTPPITIMLKSASKVASAIYRRVMNDL